MAKSIYYKNSFMAQFDFRHRFLPEPPIDLEPTPQQINEANNGIPQFVAYEPMRQNRWLINFPQELDIQPYYIYQAQRPNVSINGNGEYEWGSLNIKFRDPVDPSMSQKLWNMFLGITQNNDDVVYQNIRQNGLTFDLEMLDSTGVVVSKWTIYNSRIEGIDFGRLDYSSSELAECSLTIKPNSVTLHF